MPRSPPSTNLENDLFTTIPWCQIILADPNYALEVTWTRQHQPSTGENNLLAKVLCTPDTIEAWCSLYVKPSPDNNHSKNKVRALLALREGLNGYPQVMHGGITATLLDEIMSMLVATCRMSKGERGDNVTAELKVQYLKPVPLPSVVVVEAEVRDIQKTRKYFVDGALKNGEGVVLGKASGLFICTPADKL